MSSPYSSSSPCVRASLLIVVGCLLLCGSSSNAQLTPSFFNTTCPSVFGIIARVIVNASCTDPRIAASLIRLHAHDCFVHGCDGSVLLDNSTSFRTEKDAVANANSIRGFDVVDRMKADLERACPRTVSCADVLAIAAQASVVLSGGPWWEVPLGRRDSKEAYFELANSTLSSPFFTLDELKSNFAAVGLNLTSDLVALSGGHTFGRVQCQFIVPRLYNFNGTGQPDPTINTTYLSQLRQLCPQNGNLSRLVNLDPVTPDIFDNQYYSNLRNEKGALQSDQELFSTPGADTIPLVESYSNNTSAFFEAFTKSMIRMGNIKPLTGNQGEIRFNCRVVNPQLRGVESDEGFARSI